MHRPSPWRWFISAALSSGLDPMKDDEHTLRRSAHTMPELPEVETVRRGLESVLPGRQIIAVVAPEQEPTWVAWQAAWQGALGGKTVHRGRGGAAVPFPGPRA